MYKSIIRQLIPPVFYKKDVLAKAGIHILFQLHRLLRRKSKAQLFYDELMSQIRVLSEISFLFPEEKMKGHYIYEPIRHTLENPDLYTTQIRYYRMYKFFKKHYPKIFHSNTKVLNVGDTDGILFEALGKKGTTLNINRECIDFMRSKGLNAVLGDAEKLQFEDSSFDYIFCFQTLEHCPNPIKVLSELGRVAKEKVFLSIPYTTKTNIFNIEYWIELKKRSWKEKSVKKVDCHIFEFSTDDFKNILGYTNLEYETNFLINYFDNNSFKKRLLNKYYGSYFNFFILKPVVRRKIY